jgi:hypothetical protein
MYTAEGYLLYDPARYSQLRNVTGKLQTWV